ncbi:acetyl-CoA carboxylase biotin carboxylase subunit [Sphingomonas crusticola]|uniref:acetyl-CoA carboxylase biotin carboxylase subunit n=1 Tax=Sphingomonas crusticola TaxID=1697973 RepID=UPI000E2535F8|nr:acetyl-CoA carboxylase biotin carboxylase subunit [Sphingomonas crusticola]
MRRLGKILVANRGEIACRIMRSCRLLGKQTVAVYSEADVDALHVTMADEAICIGPAAARESYLRIDHIIEAARSTGADAIHPGYGFLSENADFADACAAAGIAFIGPPADAIRAMGMKDRAKDLASAAGLPILPSYQGEDQTPETLQAAAEKIGWPVFIKAIAGGGGRGMRRVDGADAFAAALASAQREATSSFGDQRVLLEKYLENPRHVEVQVLADGHGHVVHLFDRDCSIQRRHQKIVEEAPAPWLGSETRERMREAAIAITRAIDYRGVGTIEFIVDAGATGAFYFMEMNTRLQVEHPVSEMTTGLDLVEWQVRVAEGEALPFVQVDIAGHGHAIEVRLCAENVARNFMPSPGRLDALAFPSAVDGVRIDCGVRAGDTISPWYDPMIGKLIVWGEDRPHAVERLGAALAQCRIDGIPNNLDFLGKIVGHAAFRDGPIDTGFVERHRHELI